MLTRISDNLLQVRTPCRRSRWITTNCHNKYSKNAQ